jgi:hypothetical protein
MRVRLSRSEIGNLRTLLTYPSTDALVAGIQGLKVDEKAVEVILDPRTMQLNLYNSILALRDVCGKVAKSFTTAAQQRVGSGGRQAYDEFQRHYTNIRVRV